MCDINVFFWEYFFPHSQANCGPVTHSYFSCLSLFLLYLYCFFLQIEQTYLLSSPARIQLWLLDAPKSLFLFKFFAAFIPTFFFNTFLTVLLPLPLYVCSLFGLVLSVPLRYPRVNGKGVFAKTMAFNRSMGFSARGNNESKNKLHIKH